MGLYELDFHAWTTAQADAIRRRSANEIDWENVLEEIEALGRGMRAELRTRLSMLLTHLLKWTHQPAFRSRSWTGTIRVQRREIALLLEENPSLKASQEDVFRKAYSLARARAESETGLAISTFPAEAVFTLAQTLDEGWLPSSEPEHD